MERPHDAQTTARRAVVEIEKLRDYSLNAMHSRGKHKAHVFQIVEFVENLVGAVYASADLADASRLMVLYFRREAAYLPLYSKPATQLASEKSKWLAKFTL